MPACTHQRFAHRRSMDVTIPDVPRIARTIGDPTRIRMLTLLMDGRAATAKELAYGAGVAAATGTAHLRRLLKDELVTVRAQGRHKYFQIASSDVARCVESLMVIAPASKTLPVSTPEPLRCARFCYDHLAGKLGTELTQSMLRRGWLRQSGKEFEATDAGRRALGGIGIDLATTSRSRRQFAPACLDWSERKDHLGGALGAALATALVEKRWIKRKRGTREVQITALGEDALAKVFRIRV
jgi:DNA-binding transcriptional ArsR family regulator